MQKIIYKDKERDVVIISKPSHNYFAFDLTEYDEVERAYYISEYERLHKEYLDNIKKLGLSSNYRYFAEDKITWVNEDE